MMNVKRWVTAGIVVSALAGALVHDMRRATPEAEAPQAHEKPDASDDDEPWKRSA